VKIHFRVYAVEAYGGGSAAGSTGAFTVAVSPTAVSLNGRVTVTWTAATQNVTNHWVGLYRAGVPTTSENLFRPAWEYVWQPSGSREFTIPNFATPGQYVFHYFTDNGYQSVAATSNIFTVVP
jgi:hypothetical protein